MAAASLSSFIEPHEIEDAKKYVEEKLGFPAPRPCGYHIAVKVFLRGVDTKTFVDDKGQELKIEIPDLVGTEDKYRSCTALVLALGPDAYKGKRFEDSGPWCRVGDWVTIPRNEGHQFSYKGTIIQVIPDDRVLLVIEDPNDVTREY